MDIHPPLPLLGFELERGCMFGSFFVEQLAAI